MLRDTCPKGWTASQPSRPTWEKRPMNFPSPPLVAGPARSRRRGKGRGGITKKFRQVSALDPFAPALLALVLHSAFDEGGSAFQPSFRSFNYKRQTDREECDRNSVQGSAAVDTMPKRRLAKHAQSYIKVESPLSIWPSCFGSLTLAGYRRL